MSKINDPEKLIAHLENKWTDQRCPMCHQKEWSIQDSMYQLSEFHGGNVIIGSGSIIPIVPVICNNCGNTILINGIMSGAIERDENKNE